MTQLLLSVLIQSLIVLLPVLLGVAYLTWLERKVAGFIQVRLGPQHVGPRGLLQPIADGIKLILKENVTPLAADRAVFNLAPILAAFTAIAVLAVVPWARGYNISDINIGVLYILSVASLGVYGIVLGGWASNSKYAMFGSLRSAAQNISYEIPLGMAIAGAVLYTGTLSMGGIVEAQARGWLIFQNPVHLFGLALYAIAATAETNRLPFDLPEAEAELVAGFHTEYSSMKFALFFMGEYVNMIVVSAIAATVFLGGWRSPIAGLDAGGWGTVCGIAGGALWLGLSVWLLRLALAERRFLKIVLFIVAVGTLHMLAELFLEPEPPTGVSAFLFGLGSAYWMLLKIFVALFVMMWARWTYPRYRYDQLMQICWRILLPLALFYIFASGAVRFLSTRLG
jgi:NADH-quinone oxidoreductase subunit H